MYPTLALAATLAVGQAFLLPPTISPADKDIVDSLPFEHVAEAESRIIQIDCPGCPVAAADLAGKVHMLQMENKLQLNFSVAHEDGDKLYLNGYQVHPMSVLNPLDHPLTAPQLVRVGSEPSVAADLQLGYSLSIEQLSPFSEAHQLHIYELKLEILEVASKFIDGMDTVVLKFIKTPSGNIMIGGLEFLPPSKPSSSVPAVHDDRKECTSAICKWRAIVADKLSKLKGCNGKARPGHKTRPKHHDGHGGRPHPNGAYRHHGHHGAVVRIMRSIVLHILIPIAIGIVAGIMASLVGMVVGHLVVLVWRTLFRRESHQSQSCRFQQEEIADGSDDEVESLVKHQGPPPVYEDAPAYEEAVVDEKASEYIKGSE